MDLSASKIVVECRLFAETLVDWQPISAVIPIAWDRKWRRGDAISGTSMQKKHSGCALRDEFDSSKDIATALRRMLDEIKPYSTSLKTLRRKNGAEVQVTIAMYLWNGERPPMYFDPRVIRDLSDIGAALDIDLHWSAPKSGRSPLKKIFARRKRRTAARKR